MLLVALGLLPMENIRQDCRIIARRVAQNCYPVLLEMREAINFITSYCDNICSDDGSW